MVSFCCPSIALLASFICLSSTVFGQEAERICNGLASNCNRRVNEIMYATVHNAMSTLDDGFFVGFNNYESMDQALVAGFRAFLLDSCDCGDGNIQFCHSVCFAGTKEPSQTFDIVVQFLNDNPTEVVILEIQIEDDSLFGLWSKTPPGMQELIYSHDGTDTGWPTLNELIDVNQRLIVFQHNGPDCSAVDCPMGVHDFFDYAFQTDFSFRGADSLSDYSSSCQPEIGSVSNDFMLINHFAQNAFQLPSPRESRAANTYESLQGRVEGCKTITGRITNFLAVDFWSIGDTVQVVNDYNAQLSDDEPPAEPEPPAPAPTPAPTNGDSGGGIGCFSGETNVVVESRGMMKMGEIKLGDRVLVDSKGGKDVYEEVYSFGHINRDASMDYFQFHPSRLELSWNHLVFLEGERTPIPASLVRVGDVLDGGEPVTKIRRVVRRGVYAPLTRSGIISANGIQASTYIAYQESGFLHLGEIPTPFSFHWLSRAFEAPHRLWCLELGANCNDERYGPTGISRWVDQPVAATMWILRQNFFVMTLFLVPFVAYIVFVALLEFIVLNLGLVVLGIMASLSMIVLLRRRQRGNDSRILCAATNLKDIEKLS